MTSLYHTLDRKRWFLVPPEVSLPEGELCVRRFAGRDQQVAGSISAYEVDEAEAKAWLDTRVAAGFAKVGAAFGRLTQQLKARGATIPESVAHARPDARTVLGVSPGEIYTDPERAQEAVNRLLDWASERLKPQGSAQRNPKEALEALEAIGAALKTAASRVEARKREAEVKSGHKKLIRVGFFSELRHGDKSGSSLVESCRPEAHRNEPEIIAYLQQAPELVASPGPVRDVLAPELGYIGTPSIKTDGRFCWPADLAHYVARYHVVLPDAFLDHGRARRWRHVPFDIGAVSL